MTRIYLIGIGGTGAKCIEAIVYMASIGFFGRESNGNFEGFDIRSIFIDSDRSNGNWERTNEVIQNYEAIYKSLRDDSIPWQIPWLGSRVEMYGLVNPLESPEIREQAAGNRNLSMIFNYDAIGEKPLRHLFDTLYTERLRKTGISEYGFKGEPSIGSAVMSRINSFSEREWSNFLKDIELDLNGVNPKLFLVGSIFGGMGAAGLPTVARLLRNQFKGRVPIGGLLMLPYFSHPSPSDNDEVPAGRKPEDGVYADYRQFIPKAEAALQYYYSSGSNDFDAIYLLGSSNFSQEEKFRLGGEEQKNKQHFVELFAAWSVCDFSLKEKEISDEQRKVAIISRSHENELVWQDFPDELRQRLIDATRFAYVWLSNIGSELQSAAKHGGVESLKRNTRWFSRFFNASRGLFGSRDGLPDFSDSEKGKVDLISVWCKGYFEWMHQVHSQPGEEIKLFSKELLKEPSKDGKLPDLIIGDMRNRDGRNDDVSLFREQLGKGDEPRLRQGVVGLASALYRQCQIEKK